MTPLFCKHCKRILNEHSKNELIKLIGECYLDNNDNLEFDSSFIEETIGPYDGKICNRISNTLLPS